MNIASRKSIHGEDRIIQKNTEKTTAPETRKISSNAGKITRLRGERSDAVAEFAAIHGSQEDLYEEITHETVHSHSTRFDIETANNNDRLKPSSPLPKGKLDLPRVSRVSAQQSKLKPNSEHKVEKVHESKCLSVVFVTSLIFLGLGYFLSGFNVSDGTTADLLCSFSDLENKYPKQNDSLWKCLEFAVEDILNERINKPSVTLFVHKGSKGAKELIRDIADTASNCMDSSMEPVEFRSSDFTSVDAAMDYGVIIDKYKKTVKEGNVVMIANLNEIPAEAAKALHAICDRESPILRKVVILLSLTTEYNGERPIDIAENALYNLWEGKIKENELGPLMARVTDEVILLQGI